MKKLMALALTLSSFGFLGLGAATANAATSAKTPQIRVRIGPQRDRDWRRNREWNRNRGYNSDVRTVQTSRFVRRGFHTYRETYLIRYYANGRSDTTLIARQRIS
jgi:Ni/Co efflux regulator RcnB